MLQWLMFTFISEEYKECPRLLRREKEDSTTVIEGRFKLQIVKGLFYLCFNGFLYV